VKLRLLKNIIFGFITVTLVLGSLEYILRVIPSLQDLKAQTPKKYLRQGLTAESPDQIASLKSIPEKEPGEYLIICMGDSVTYGFKMDRDQTYPAELEKLLESNFPQVRVVNLGQVGTSLIEGLKFYLESVRSLKPDLIILCYGVNDHFYNPMPDLDNISIPSLPVIQMQKFLHKSAIYMKVKELLKTSSDISELNSVRVDTEQFKYYLELFYRSLIKDAVELVVMNALSANYDRVLMEYGKIMKDFSDQHSLLMIDLYNLFPIYAGKDIDFIGDKDALDSSEKIRQLKPLKITNLTIAEYFIDAYHLNQIGYQIIAKIIADQLQGEM
jgi:lysophospholipase L1-like esterase